MANTKNNDIAVIGLACRFPGAQDYIRYWQNLIASKISIQVVPKQRWNWQAYYGDPARELGKTYSKHAGFIEGMDEFDASFFGIPPKEADYMDPQHRIFLECAWHAIENAGYKPNDFSGTRTGVYCGVSKNDYAELMREARVEITPFISTGTVHSLIANRVSFFLNLNGSSEVVDTACSSSLVALNRAINDIQQRHCDAAIVGGVNAILSPTMTIAHSRSGMLSPSGEIKTFDRDANGYVRGEGVAAILIKPLLAAEAAGNYIWGVIKSVAVNHGGRSNFLTSPNPDAQAAVIQKAIEAANVCPTSISYIECHGTGTKLGDPIEIEGLKKAYQKLLEMNKVSQAKNQCYSFCALGSVKPNIGHLEPVAGLAGLIKVLLAMKHRQLPGLANYQVQNPYIDLINSPFYILGNNQEWKSTDRLDVSGPLRAGINSFGMGGVNSHAIVEAYPMQSITSSITAMAFFIPFSTKKGQMNDYLQSYREFLKSGEYNPADLPESQFLYNLSYTLSVGRETYDERVAFVISSIDELLAGIENHLNNMLDDVVFYKDDQSRKKNNNIHSLTALQHFAMSWVNAETNDIPLIRGQRIPLPGYPFQKQRRWFDTTPIQPSPEKAIRPIQIQTNDQLPETQNIAHKIEINQHFYYLRHHYIQEKLLLPGAAHFEFVRQALSSRHKDLSGIEFKNVYWLRPYHVAAQKELAVSLNKSSEKHYHYSIHNGPEVYVKGSCTLRTNQTDLSIPNYEFVTNKVLATRVIYQELKDYGIHHGEFFQVIDEIQLGNNFAIAKAQLHKFSEEEMKSLFLNPCLIDGVFQVVTHLGLSTQKNRKRQYVPFCLGKTLFYRAIPQKFLIYVTTLPQSQDALLKYNMVLYDEQHKLIATFTEFIKKALHDE